MPEKIVAISLTEEKQIEILRISMDNDKDKALEFVKYLKEEIDKREKSQCNFNA